MSMTSMMLTTLLEFRPEHHPPAGGAGGGGASSLLGAVFGLVFGLIGLVIGLIMIASSWKIFTKAGEAGWMSLIPVLNLIILLKIARKPAWWVILLMVPFVNFVILILLNIELAKAFGQGVGFAVGLLLLPMVFFPILAFGSARYSPSYG